MKGSDIAIPLFKPAQRIELGRRDGELEPDAELREGDALRFFYSSPRPRYMAIIDEDEAFIDEDGLMSTAVSVLFAQQALGQSDDL